jgi:23S rRNA (cytosine1962-C5)-methyltransferase
LLELWPDFRPEWVVYEDDDLIVVDKPAGVPSQAAQQAHDDDLVVRLRRWLAARRGCAPEDVYLGVHQRLDRDTSGLVLFTLRREANAAIAQQFQARSVEKTYVAASAGRAPRGDVVLEDALARGEGGRMQVVARAQRGAKLARTRVSVRQRHGERMLLELGCDTGRTHQLRVQLAHAHAPIAGDRLYGDARALRLLLHAERLALRSPAGRPLALRAPAPPEIDDWLRHGAHDAAAEPELLARALSLAIESRYRLGRARAAAEPTTAFRLFHRAADGAAELAVDVYDEFLVAHLFGPEIESREAELLDALAALGPAGVYVKRHPRQKNELVEPRDARYAPVEPLRGHAAADELVIHEHGLPFGVRLGDGLRTGLFLDQRDNRARVRALAAGKRVLNLFAYTSGFSVAALAGGAAEAVCVDASASALAWGRRNVERIGAQARHRAWHHDAFEALAELARKRERFDLIVLDPPSYSKTRGRRFVLRNDYAALCESCLRVLEPSGMLLACVNHHGTSQAKLRRDVRAAAHAARRALAQLKDYPTQLDFPAEPGAEPHSKSVLAICGTAPAPRSGASTRQAR